MDLKRRTFLGFLGAFGLIGCTEADSEEVTDDPPQTETPRYGYGGTPVESTPTPTPTDRISTPRIDQRIDVGTNPGNESGAADPTTPAQDSTGSVASISTPESEAGGSNPESDSADAGTDSPTETTTGDTGGDGSSGQPPAADPGDNGGEADSDDDVLEEYTVTVYVTDTAGTAITADVSLDDVVRVAENGIATFETVTADDYYVEASADGYRTESRILSIDSDTQTTLLLAETDNDQEWCAAENEKYATQGYGEYGYGGVVPCT